MMQEKKSLSAGFTLLEVTLYVATASLLLGAVALGYTGALAVSAKQQTIQEVEAAGAAALVTVQNFLAHAPSVAEPEAGDTSPILRADNVAAAGGSDLEAGLSDGRLYADIDGRRVFLTGARFAVSNLLFENRSASGEYPGSIRVRFTIERQNPSGRNEFTYRADFIGGQTLYR